MNNQEASEPLIIACATAGCGKRLRVGAEMAGKRVRCPQCRQVISVPARATASSAVPAAAEASRATARAGAGPLERKVRLVPAWIAWVTSPRPKLRTAFRYTLVVSLAVHAAFTPLIPHGGLSPEQAQIQETEYMKKISAAKSASVVAKQIGNKITMPPPPPDPESVVSNTLNQALTTDIEKVVGKLLDVQVTSKLTRQVSASMKEQLAAAAKDIAAGKMSEEDIQKLHEKFKQQAHASAVTALREHRIETQVERAAMTTTEWYEDSVARTIMNNITYELFHKPHTAVWPTSFCMGVKGANHGVWGFVHLWFGDRWNFVNRITAIGDLAGNGAYSDYNNSMKAKGRKIQNNRMELEGWPSAHPNQPEIILALVSNWQKEWEFAYNGYVRDFHPHRENEIREKYGEQLNSLWKEVLDKAEAYKNRAASSTSEADLKAEFTAFFDTLKKLHKAARELQAPQGECAVINQAIRSQVLRGKFRDEMHKYIIDEWVKGLDPLIRNFAKGQFKKNIIVNKGGLDQVMKDFTNEIIPLLRRDFERVLPKKKFDTLIFLVGGNPYKSKVTGEGGPPNDDDIKNDEKAMADVLAKRPDLKAYAEKRTELVAQEFKEAVGRVKEEIITRVLTGGLLLKDMGNFVAGTDTADKVQEKLDARASALAGRGQDLAKLTSDGVPDTSAPLIALMFGASKGHGANLEPVSTELQPDYVSRGRSQLALRPSQPKMPPPPAKWGFETQAEIKPQFKIPSPRVEAIPFLSKFPRLDGNLSDWGKIRPLVLQAPKGQEPVLVYAAWNYQGFFFGYSVKQAEEKYYYPSQWGQTFNHNTGDVGYVKIQGTDWAYKGDFFRLVFDTLDARNQNRGEPHSQEFVMFPRGTDNDPDMPGIERLFESQRNAKANEYRSALSTCKVFLQQPPPEQGPDGTGPYRVTQFSSTGYTVEAFIPRSLFNIPVFAPGWFIGFNCSVGTGFQYTTNNRFVGHSWVPADMAYGPERSGLNPSQWGDLMLLGTDPRMICQAADEHGSVAQGVVPGHSYLVTVIDPDRNVYPTAEDTVLVSAEVTGGNNDVEVYIFKETDKNSGIFRGYINTQPGAGREVQGVLEVAPGQQVRFGYVDFANARGDRNVITELKLPVVSSVMTVANKSHEAAE